ncbi:integrative and conjugative element protein, VC0181 family [Terriglobus roseus]|uniref:Integrative and conjugative element protein, VC0181 family n=1 Tax=Terriglobus roseus TaxID=392734 RepID=A0A1G7GBT4_9BACT|nr:integrative and conjugative element protein, VC0181 family [Terriglobus roseus]
MQHQQTSPFANEAGGQLFARISPSCISILRATGPRPTDHRTRYGYIPDHTKEQNEINEMFKEGLLFIGDWHTHPQKIPSPSRSDQLSIRNVFRGSRHHLPALLLLIAGTEGFPAGLHLSFHSADTDIKLEPI